jgi:hypothetical protein
MDYFSMIVWSLWKSRKDSIFNNALGDPLLIVHIASFLLSDYQGQSNASIIGEPNVRWHPPPKNCFKINADVDISLIGRTWCGYY